MNSFYKDTIFHGPEPENGWPVRFAVITACNPDGLNSSPNANELANRRLEEEMGKEVITFSPMTGASPDAGHREPGYLAQCNFSAAVDLGRRFGQEAIFWIEEDRLHLVSCSEEQGKRPIDSWQARYKGSQVPDPPPVD